MKEMRNSNIIFPLYFLSYVIVFSFQYEFSNSLLVKPYKLATRKFSKLKNTDIAIINQTTKVGSSINAKGYVEGGRVQNVAKTRKKNVAN